jgi:hypothetical protein
MIPERVSNEALCRLTAGAANRSHRPHGPGGIVSLVGRSSIETRAMCNVTHPSLTPKTAKGTHRVPFTGALSLNSAEVERCDAHEQNRSREQSVQGSYIAPWLRSAVHSAGSVRRGLPSYLERVKSLLDGFVGALTRRVIESQRWASKYGKIQKSDHGLIAGDGGATC